MGALEGSLNLKIDVYVSGVFQSSYLHLKEAFDKINDGTHSGMIEVRIKAGTSETASAVLNASGTGSASYSSIIIFPTATGIRITGNLAAPLIDLNGADNVTIDGRVNASGTAKSLVISNTNTGTYASTIRLIASAENNTVKYCLIQGSETSTGKGVVFFSSASTGNGNDGNTLTNNIITGNVTDRPFNAIYSAGTTGRENTNNIISNNDIYNFLRTSSNSYGIFIQYASNDWTISGNSFFETSPFTPLAGNTYHVIHVTTSTNHMISGNFIGGTAALCGGAAWTVNSNFPHYFCGIFIEGGNPTATIVENNTIRNIQY
ncbi:MAG: hypothetical protein NTW16_07585, partial [Bacteroidetes bacterium]|nr:hypothetical protein [Bacteroidota bacterium]